MPAVIGGSGENQATELGRLRSAELGKHKALLASIMRTAPGAIPEDYERALGRPYQLLRDVEAGAPQAIADLLATPQFGAWADDCLRHLLTAEGGDGGGVPLATDLGQLALFAVTAAIRVGQSFRLEVPLRDGRAYLPALGTAHPGAGTQWEWGTAWGDRHQSWVRSLTSAVEIRPGASAVAVGRWSAIHRIALTENGLRLDVLLDDSDPYLDRYGSPRARLTAEALGGWRRLLASAWATLTTDHHQLAGLIAGIVRTVVPLAPPAPTRPAGSTEIAAFGAVALSPAADGLSLAESLVHEVHHALLGALTDMQPLVNAAVGTLTYVPWRDDPRPGGALLHGTVAHYGMGRFWREHYRAGPSGQRGRAAVEFGRMRVMAARGLAALDESGLLTPAGERFMADIRADLVDWLGDGLPAEAGELVAELNAEHEARWRVAHLIPATHFIADLADAWRAGRGPSVPYDIVPTRLQPGPLPPAAGNVRSYLMALRGRDPELLGRRLADGQWRIDPADAALIRGDRDAAATGYLQRIATGGDPGAWAGLAIVRRRTAPAAVARVFLERPEVLAALYGTLRNDPGCTPDALARWLAP